MTELLIRMFVKDSDNTANPDVRARYVRLGGFTGIVCNLFLFSAKLITGLLSGSISILADAFNNLSDMGSSLVTLFGFKLASKPADRQHPFGHGRMEYMSGFIVACIIIVVGVELFKGAIDRILHPQTLSVSAPALFVLVVSILIKLWMSRFNSKIGKKISSAALTATAFDSLSDVISTGAVLVSTAITMLFDVVLDGYIGAVVSAFIIFSGIKIAKDTLNPLLGEAPGQDTVRELEHLVMSYDGIIGVHDMIIHNYGPGRCFACLHVEVPADADVLRSHDVIDNCEREVGAKMGMELVIHMDPIITNDKLINETREQVRRQLIQLDERLSMHDFRMVAGDTHTNLIFDVVVPPGYVMSDEELTDKITQKVREDCPDTFCVLHIDRNYAQDE